MFTKKHDPLVDSVKSVMEKNNLRRQVEEALNEELGISSRKAVPHEHLASYDAMFEEVLNEAEDYSKDFHVVGPHGRTVEVTTSEESAKKAAKEYGEGYKVYRGDKLPPNWKGSGTGSKMFAGTKETVKEVKEGSEPRNDEEAKLAALKEPYDEITRADVLKGRGVIKQEEAKVAVGNKPTTRPAKGVPHALEEKATEAQKEKVAKVMREFKKKKLHSGSKKGPKVTDKEQAIAIALSQAGLSKKQKMDESIESIMEEIRANLEEKLVSVYESGDAQMFEEFVSSLTEEQIEILGLNEVFGDYAGDPSILSRASQQTYLNQQRQAAGQRTISAARPSAAPTAAPTARPSAAPTAAPAARSATPAPAAGRPAPAPAAKPTSPTPATGARAAAEVVPGEGRKPAPVTGEPPAGSPQYQGAKEAGAGNADLAPTPQAVAKQTPIKPTFEPRAQPAGTAASGTGTADLTPSPSTGIGKTLDGGSTPAPTPPTERRGTAGAFARAAREQRAGSADIGQQQESTHLKESLESMIRSRYLKG